MSEYTKAARERAKRIINELRKKTEDRGCTEEEALAAARTIGDLLEKYDLEMTETDVREDAASCRQIEVYAADNFAGVLVTGIGKFCTLVVYENRHEGHACKYVMFGTPQDLEMGEYLYEMCAEAMERGWSDYMEVHGYSMAKRSSFRQGFSSRVHRRLRELKEERDRRTMAATGTALVVLKDQLVTTEFAKQGVKLGKSAPQRAVHGHAYQEGRAAGDRVNLERPLGGGADSSYITNG
jgi:hypothetical protein